MLHYSRALENKHQNEHKTPPQIYLYENHVAVRKMSGRLSAEVRDELEDDVYAMRRHFKRTVKKLRRSMYYSNWLKNITEIDNPSERMRLRSRHA